MTPITGLPFSRRQLIAGSLLAGAAVTAGGAAAALQSAEQPLPAPADDQTIPVAFLLDEGATIIDFCGPWEVFQDAGGRFNLFTVAPSAEPLRASAGMRIIPDYTLADAPEAKVIVIPAQSGGRRDAPTTAAKVAWLRERHAAADVVLSVCTGAFLLARTGLLDGLNATTHHDFLADFARDFPRVNLQRHRRYVDNGKIVTSGGLTSGVDAALHIVARYFGLALARQAADYMEYESRSWIEGAAGNA